MSHEEIAKLIGQVVTVLGHLEERADAVKQRQDHAETVLYDAARDVRQASNDIGTHTRTAISERLKPVETHWKRISILFTVALSLVAIGLAWAFYYQYKTGEEIKNQYTNLAHAREFSEAINSGVLAICENDTLCIKADKKAKRQGDYVLIKK